MADFSIKHPLYDEDHSTSRNSFFRLAESLNFALVKKTRHPIAVRLLDDRSGQPIGDLTYCDVLDR